MTTTTTEALRPVTQLSEYIPVKHAAPKADCIDLYLIALTQLHTPDLNNSEVSQIVTVYAIRPYDIRDSLLIRPRTVHSRRPDGSIINRY